MSHSERLSPHGARDRTEFAGLLRLLKERSGLTYRQLEERAAARGDVLPRSTLADVLAGKTAPRREQLAAFVRACGDGGRTEEWLRAWDDLAARAAAGTGPARQPRRDTEPEAGPGPGSGPDSGADSGAGAGAGSRRPRLAGRAPLLLAAAGITLVAAVSVWWLTAGNDPERRATTGHGSDTGSTAGPASAGPQDGPPKLPSGAIRIRPLSAPDLCLTDGEVRDGRYPTLVAVQRPCDDVPPQTTVLEQVGADTYRIQWHHPEFGKGCLKVLPDGPGAKLLEPRDACADADAFRIEASGEEDSGRYVLHADADGDACVGIRNSDPSEGAEAVAERCTEEDGQVFVIEPVP
ncbi:helix-turn-helix domain-containing protein [Streptomyces sp. NPDC048845]|uniref:helix-turn-helix domain-containing protein n=1 Tax=Streptomyces sp. NPDC048845 TaxID=3155390 RepID=UPI0034412DB3